MYNPSNYGPQGTTCDGVEYIIPYMFSLGDVVNCRSNKIIVL
jgi:hypothetical protein